MAGGGEQITTIGNWRGYGSVEHEGVKYGQKAHSMRDLMSLAARTDAPFLLALDIHPDETPDLEALDRNGWHIVDPATVASDPDSYREFIAGSQAELGIAKSGYVLSRCGWFSDRSACYLASGKPVVAQDTGFGRFLPTGAGLLAFASEDDALAAVEEVRSAHRPPRAGCAGDRRRAPRFAQGPRTFSRAGRERRLSPAPDELRARLQDALTAHEGAPVTVTELQRRPCEYRTSFALEELDVVLADGRALRLMFKDLSRACLAADALLVKPAFLHDPAPRDRGLPRPARRRRPRDPRLPRCVRRSGRRPALAVHRERHRSRAVAGR